MNDVVMLVMFCIAFMNLALGYGLRNEIDAPDQTPTYGLIFEICGVVMFVTIFVICVF